MKVLMVLENNFPPDTRVENEINTLTNAGYDVDIVCLNQGNDQKVDSFGKAKIFRIPISSFKRKTSVGVLRLPIYFNFWRKVLKKILNQNSYDVIHIHDLQLAKLGAELSMKYKLKFVLDLHENWPALLDLSEHTKSLLGQLLFSLKQWKKYEQKFLKLADEIIVVIDESKQRIVNLGVESERVHIVANTLNLSEFDFLIPPKTSSKLIYAYAGGVTYHRGLQYVVEAASITHTTNFEIWIIGDGRYLSRLKDQANALGLNEKVKFWGWQDRNQLLKLISKADVNLIPHIKSDHTDSTIPHKLFQYMFAEKPILASNCSPIERIINETSSGIIYPYNHVAALAKTIDDINQGKIKLNDYARGKRAVLEKYNWEVDSRNLLDLYNRLKH